MTKPIAWSYSALSKFETCPYQFYRVKVAKDVKDSMNEAALWGNRLHKAIEDHITGKKEMPKEFHKYRRYADRLIATDSGMVKAEQQLAITPRFKPVSWFGKDVWCRGIIDAAVFNKSGTHALLLDWKTGKRKPDSDQLALFAGLAFIHYPQLKTATTGFVWFKDGKVDKEQYHRTDQKDIWREFLPRVKRIEDAHAQNKWPCKPSGLCRGWCPVKDCDFYEGR